MKKKKSKGKKVFALMAVAAAVSAVVLGACAKKKADERAEDEENAAESVDMGGENSEAEAGAEAENESGAEDAGQEAKEELVTLLNRVRDGVRPGSAGCSLRASGVAVELLKWGKKGSMSAADAAAVTKDYINTQAGDAFSESIALVDEAYKDLRGERAESMLNDIGYTMIDKTWGNEAIPVIEAVMEAAGQR